MKLRVRQTRRAKRRGIGWRKGVIRKIRLCNFTEITSWLAFRLQPRENRVPSARDFVGVERGRGRAGLLDAQRGDGVGIGGGIRLRPLEEGGVENTSPDYFDILGVEDLNGPVDNRAFIDDDGLSAGGGYESDMVFAWSEVGDLLPFRSGESRVGKDL